MVGSHCLVVHYDFQWFCAHQTSLEDRKRGGGGGANATMMSQLIDDPSCTTQSPVTTTKTFPTTLSVFRTETDTSELVNCSFVCFYSPTIA